MAEHKITYTPEQEAEHRRREARAVTENAAPIAKAAKEGNATPPPPVADEIKAESPPGKSPFPPFAKQATTPPPAPPVAGDGPVPASSPAKPDLAAPKK